MKNLAVIESLFSVMNATGISLKDMNAYAKNQNQELSIERTKLPLEILYENDYRSFFFEADKTPVAIICDNIGFAFEDAPEIMNWNEAKKYCEQYSVGGKKWQLPNKVAGHIDLLYKNKEAINEVLTAFGQETLKKAWYWSLEYSYNLAWVSYFSGSYGLGYYGKDNDYASVRPVLAL